MNVLIYIQGVGEKKKDENFFSASCQSEWFSSKITFNNGISSQNNNKNPNNQFNP